MIRSGTEESLLLTADHVSHADFFGELSNIWGSPGGTSLPEDLRCAHTHIGGRLDDRVLTVGMLLQRISPSESDQGQSSGPRAAVAANQDHSRLCTLRSWIPNLPSRTLRRAATSDDHMPDCYPFNPIYQFLGLSPGTRWRGPLRLCYGSSRCRSSAASSTGRAADS